MAGRLFTITSGLFSALPFALVSASFSDAAPLTVAPLQSLSTEMVQAEKTTFWGRPYPYGYAYHQTASCYVRRHVHGRHGWYWKRVYVCGGPVRKD